MSDEKIGYLQRAVEDLTAEAANLYRIVKEHMEKEDEDRKALLLEMKTMRDRIDELEERQLVHNTILKTLKAIGALVLGILTVNVGDVLGIFKLFG